MPLLLRSKASSGSSNQQQAARAYIVLFIMTTLNFVFMFADVTVTTYPFSLVEMQPGKQLCLPGTLCVDLLADACTTGSTSEQHGPRAAPGTEARLTK